MNSLSRKDEHESQTYDVFGMWCTSCAKALEKHVSKLDGVEQVKVDFATAQVTVKSFSKVDPNKLSDSVSELGYSLLKSFSNQTDDEFKIVKQSYLIRNSIVSFLSMWSVAFSISFYSGGTKEFLWASAFTGLVGSLYGLLPILKMAYISIKTLTVTFDLLVAIANLALIFVSTANLLNGQNGVFFESIVMTISVVLWSRYLDLQTRFKLRSHILKDLIQTEVEVEVEVEISGEWKKNNLQAVREGRNIRVFADQQIPFDGISMTENVIYVDNSHLSGESTLVRINRGDQVYAGSTLKSSSLTFKVTKIIGHRKIDTLFSKSLEITNNTNHRWLKSTVENWSAIILLLSLVYLFFNLVIKGNSVFQSIEASAILLLVTCPCALIIIEPLTKLWIQKKSLKEKFYLNPNKLSSFDKPIAFVFDKTGTLVTSNDMQPRLINYSNLLNDRDVEYIIASTCFQHPHPLTKRIIKNFKINELDTSGDRELFLNKGILWTTSSGAEVRVGSKNWLCYQFETDRDFDVGLSVDGVLYAGIKYESQISKQNFELLSSLNKMNYSLFLLTGDTALNTSKMEGLQLFKEVHSNHSPEAKGMFVNQLKENFSVVYIGDGINDLLAHAQADLGIHVSDRKSTLASLNQTSSVTLSSDSLSKLTDLLKMIKSFYRRQQLAFISGLFYNLILIPTALISTIHPIVAVISMTVSTGLISFICLKEEM